MKKLIFSKKNNSNINSMVAYWQMENNVVDSKGTNNGIATDITYADGIVGKSAVFNGISSQINAQYSTFDFSESDNFTFIMPIKVKVFPGTFEIAHPIMIQSSTDDSVYDKGFRIFNNGRISFYVFDGAGKTVTSPIGTLTLNRWHIITGIFDGTNLKLYNDNNLLSSIPCSGSYNHTNPRLVMSQYNPASSVRFNGELDEVSIYNNALSINELTSVLFKIKNGEHLDI